MRRTLFIIQAMNIQSIVNPFGGLGARLSLIVTLLLTGTAQADVLAARAIDLWSLPSLGQILPVLTGKRVVFVGETHDQYSHHVVQLAVIRALHQQHRDIAIGMEQFHRIGSWKTPSAGRQGRRRRRDYTVIAVSEWMRTPLYAAHRPVNGTNS